MRLFQDLLHISGRKNRKGLLLVTLDVKQTRIVVVATAQYAASPDDYTTLYTSYLSICIYLYIDSDPISESVILPPDDILYLVYDIIQQQPCLLFFPSSSSTRNLTGTRKGIVAP
jgi:hypothetical protein